MDFVTELSEIEIKYVRTKEDRHMYNMIAWGVSVPFWDSRARMEGRYKSATVTCRNYAPGKCSLDVEPGEKA